MAYCYFGGAIVDESKASISIHNLGVQRGFGIFDLFRGRNGKPVFMEDHLERFDRSQLFLGLSRLITRDEIRQAVRDLQLKNSFKESTFKLMLLGDGSESEPVLDPLFYITNTDMAHHKNPPSANAILYEYLREYPEIKSINYLTSNHLHRQKIKANAVDAIYYANGLVSEASRSNVFVVKDGIIRTPKDHILAGITRKNLLSFASDIAPVEVANVSLDELKTADEVFISSTLKEILPIVKLDEQQVGDGRIGPVTQQLQERFSDHLHH